MVSLDQVYTALKGRLLFSELDKVRSSAPGPSRAPGRGVRCSIAANISTLSTIRPQRNPSPAPPRRRHHLNHQQGGGVFAVVTCHAFIE